MFSSILRLRNVLKHVATILRMIYNSLKYTMIYFPSVEDMEAQPESEVKTTKKVASPNTTVLDQKKSESARLLQCELGRLACKSSSHMHLNKVFLLIFHTYILLGSQYMY